MESTKKDQTKRKSNTFYRYIKIHKSLNQQIYQSITRNPQKRNTNHCRSDKTRRNKLQHCTEEGTELMRKGTRVICKSWRSAEAVTETGSDAKERWLHLLHYLIRKGFIYATLYREITDGDLAE